MAGRRPLLLAAKPCGGLLRRPRLPGHPRVAVANIARMALLRFLLLRPFAGRGLDRIQNIVRDIARALGFVSRHRAAPRRW